MTNHPQKGKIFFIYWRAILHSASSKIWSILHKAALCGPLVLPDIIVIQYWRRTDTHRQTHDYSGKN